MAIAAGPTLSHRHLTSAHDGRTSSLQVCRLANIVIAFRAGPNWICRRSACHCRRRFVASTAFVLTDIFHRRRYFFHRRYVTSKKLVKNLQYVNQTFILTLHFIGIGVISFAVATEPAAAAAAASQLSTLCNQIFIYPKY
jgi:hypothetical protein